MEENEKKEKDATTSKGVPPELMNVGQMSPTEVPQSPALSPASAPGSQTNPLATDMAKILGSIKLPERRPAPSPVPTGEPQKAFDTSLVGGPDQPAPEQPVSPSLQQTISSPIPVSGTTPDVPITPADGSKGDLRSLHTLQDDLQHVVQENKISYVSAVALQGEKRHKNEAASGITVRKRRSLIS